MLKIVVIIWGILTLGAGLLFLVTSKSLDKMRRVNNILNKTFAGIDISKLHNKDYLMLLNIVQEMLNKPYSIDEVIIRFRYPVVIVIFLVGISLFIIGFGL